MLRGLHLALSSRVQPILARSRTIFHSNIHTNTNPNINTQARNKTKTNMAGETFVLKEYNNVPVTAQGLEKDQLTNWPPFKVSTRADCYYHRHNQPRAQRPES